MIYLPMVANGTFRTMVEEGGGLLLIPQCGNIGTLDRKVAAFENAINLRTNIRSIKTRPSGWRKITRMLLVLGLKKVPAVQVVPTATSQGQTTSVSSGNTNAS